MQIDLDKIAGLAKWPTELKSEGDVRSTMGLIGYHRRHIRGFACIAQPILETIKKKNMEEGFKWTPECTQALKELIRRVTSDPILKCPDPSRPFELVVDASAFAIGAILQQRDDQGKIYDVGYYSKALNETERNYDIWDREFMAVIFGLRNWRHLLSGSPHKVICWTDHANLQYYRHPQKINRRVARYISTLAEYDLELKHLPGIKNRADPLSRRPDYTKGEEDNNQVTALPQNLFARAIEVMALERQIQLEQGKDEDVINQWKDKYKLQSKEGNWWKGTALVVTKPEEIAKELLQRYHDAPTAGHPGVTKTIRQIVQDYWWPELRKFVQEYIKGCGICQQNKAITHPNQPPLNPIKPEGSPEPFKTISIDLIVKLPKSKGFDSILTITDQGSTKAVILIPCKETMTAEELAQEYKAKAFPYIGLPSRLISDRDTRFTSKIFWELCEQLGIKQNLSSAYHPQTDGESERTNQSVEVALRIFCNYRQDDWAEWLPVVQYQMNAHESSTTKKIPFEVWMGYVPRAHQPDRLSNMPELERKKQILKEVRETAREAMARAQEKWIKPTRYKPYQVGEKVWLEGRNLRTFHPSTKLRPKRFGPFTIKEVLSSTTYRLELPATWTIHNQ